MLPFDFPSFSYKKSKTCAMDIYSEGLILVVKRELRNTWAYIGEGGTVYYDFAISFRDSIRILLYFVK